MKKIVSVFGLIGVLSAALSSAPAADKSTPVLGRKIADFSLPDAAGVAVESGKFKDAKAFVVVFVGTECPISNAYLPRLAELSKQYASRGVQFLAINANRQDTPAKVAQHAKEYSLPFPVLKDAGNRIADLFGAQRTPTAFVLDAQRIIRYDGRIDDQFGSGFKRSAPTRHDLTSALDELLTGKEITQAETQVMGCFIGRVPKVKSGGEITYARQVSRILQQNCQECHRAGQIGPMSLASYDDAVAWSETIREVLQDGRMPPWFADPRFGHFANDRSLSSADRTTLVTWIDSGMARGEEKDMPPARVFESSWTIGKARLLEVHAVAQRPEHLGHVGVADRHPLEEVERGLVMFETYDDNGQRAGRLPGVNPVGPAAVRTGCRSLNLLGAVGTVPSAPTKHSTSAPPTPFRPPTTAGQLMAGGREAPPDPSRGGSAPTGPTGSELGLAPKLVEAHDLELDREVDVAQQDVGWNGQHPRGEVQDRAHSDRHQQVGDVLGGGAGVVCPDRRGLPPGEVGQRGHVQDGHRADDLADDVRVGVEERGDPEAPGQKPSEFTRARPRFPMPMITTGQSWSTPSARSIGSAGRRRRSPSPGCRRSPTGTGPCGPWPHSPGPGRPIAPGDVPTPVRSSSERMRWYTGNRTTVASGIRRRLGSGRAPGPGTDGPGATSGPPTTPASSSPTSAPPSIGPPSAVRYPSGRSASSITSSTATPRAVAADPSRTTTARRPLASVSTPSSPGSRSPNTATTRASAPAVAHDDPRPTGVRTTRRSPPRSTPAEA